MDLSFASVLLHHYHRHNAEDDPDHRSHYNKLLWVFFHSFISAFFVVFHNVVFFVRTCTIHKAASYAQGCSTRSNSIRTCLNHW
mgnify:CR=1 FL=1